MFIKLTDYYNDQAFYLDSERIVKFEDASNDEVKLTKVFTETEVYIVVGKFDHLARQLNGEAVEDAIPLQERFKENICAIDESPDISPPSS